MSGHSHWATIRRKKEGKDAKRGKIFSKLAKAISVAARAGGDPESNYKLKTAIEQGRSQGLPRDNIERAVRKGTGEESGSSLEEIVYEGLGPEKIHVMVDCVTDNRNRTTTELRKLFERRGGRMGEPNSVAWNFERKGHLAVPREAIGYDALFDCAVEAGAENVETVGDQHDIICAPGDLEVLRKMLVERGLTVTVCELTRVPKSTEKITDKTKAGKIFDFIGELEEHDDVNGVNANFEIPDDIIAGLGDS
jgi:YebC/PmpR family DNA-binding regulatory protein